MLHQANNAGGSVEDQFVDVCSMGCEEAAPSANSTVRAILLPANLFSQLHCSVLHNSHQQAAPLVCAAASSAPKSTETTASVAAAAEEGKVTVSRKEKSLGKLCKRFLLAMEEESRGGDDVHLETVAKKMSVEKRRIYDIVNVMEALEAMNKTNKSFYKWNGLGGLPRLMASLQHEAMNSTLPEKVEKVERAMCTFSEFVPTTGSTGPTPSHGRELLGLNPDPVGLATSTAMADEDEEDSRDESIAAAAGQHQLRDRNGKNSLAHLCRRFLMVLLCNPNSNRRVSLDVASTVLIKDPESEGFEPPSRSRCRRLYDIANVLVAMGLIRKVHYLFGTKKIPLFVYCGPEPCADESTGSVVVEGPRAEEIVGSGGGDGGAMREFMARMGLHRDGAEEGNDENSGNVEEDWEAEKENRPPGHQVKRPLERPFSTNQAGLVKRARFSHHQPSHTGTPLPRPQPQKPLQPNFSRPVLPCAQAGTSWLDQLSQLTTQMPATMEALQPLLAHMVQQSQPQSFTNLTSKGVGVKEGAGGTKPVRHSVLSILGVSQRENIAANTSQLSVNNSHPSPSSIQQSPKAFKPVNQAGGGPVRILPRQWKYQ